MVNLTHLGTTGNLLLDIGLEHTFHSALNLLDGIINDGVQTDVHTLLLSGALGRCRRTHLETDDVGIAGGSQSDITLSNGTHSLVDDIYLHLGGRELDERVAQCLDRTINVTLDNNVEFVELAQRAATADVLEAHSGLGAAAQLTLQLLTLISDLTGLLVGVHYIELITSGGSAV